MIELINRLFTRIVVERDKLLRVNVYHNFNYLTCEFITSCTSTRTIFNRLLRDYVIVPLLIIVLLLTFKIIHRKRK